VRDLVRASAKRLARAKLAFGHGTATAWDEAAYLVLHALGHSPLYADAQMDRPVTPTQVRAAFELIARRIRSRVPAAYLTHEAWLAGHRFYVDERVLVPRSFLAEWILNDLGSWIAQPQQIRRVLELCTGSGCLAVLLAKALPHARIDAVDISADALAVARRNVARYRLSRRVRLLESDLFAALGETRYELILANPPYVSARAMARLPREYRQEPRLALAGGRNGLDCVRRILAHAPDYLDPQGILVMELGHARKRVERAFPHTPFTWLETAAGDAVALLLRRDEIPHACAPAPVERRSDRSRRRRSRGSGSPA
jgi:ribosomal protein L3 glutamine methyltransferase